MIPSSVISTFHTADTDKTRQNKTVLSFTSILTSLIVLIRILKAFINAIYNLYVL